MSKLQYYDPTEKWLGSVAYSKSGSKATEDNYRRHFSRYQKFIGRSAEEIMAEYDAIIDFNEFRKFRDRIADEIKIWIISMRKDGFADSSIRTMVGVVQSFFKYSRINIGFIPTAQNHGTYHNRDIERKEIAVIMATSLPRDRAFYAVMAQSGLRPVTICKLQIKHIEFDRLLREESPVKIDVPKEIAKGKYHSYFTFITDDAIKNLKSYLKTRNMSRDSYLFVKVGSENTPMRSAGFSKQFNIIVRKLREKGSLDFELRKNKPSELRLYVLRKFFEKYAHKAGEEFSEFWMGHKVGVQDHYRARDVEHHRQLYAEKASPDLRIEKSTPRETERQMDELREQLKNQKGELKTMKRMLTVLLKPDTDIENTKEIAKQKQRIIDGLSSEELVTKIK